MDTVVLIYKLLKLIKEPKDSFKMIIKNWKILILMKGS